MREEVAHDASMAEARRNEALLLLKEEKMRVKESDEVLRVCVCVCVCVCVLKVV